jgi:hypothetical protein
VLSFRAPVADFLPHDPTTWSDFKDSGARGFTKVDCDTTLEDWLSGGATIFAIVAGIWIMFLVDPGGHRTAPLPPEVRSWTGPVFLLVGASILAVARLLTDNFYLVDPARHLVYYHFRFAFFRNVRLLLERKDITAVTTQAQYRRTRYSSWWEYRVVLVDTRGNVLPLSNWRRDALWNCNNDASDLAKKLECEWHAAPDQSRLVISVQNGTTTTKFVPFTWWTRVGSSRLAILTLLFVVAAALATWARR